MEIPQRIRRMFGSPAQKEEPEPESRGLTALEQELLGEFAPVGNPDVAFDKTRGGVVEETHLTPQGIGKVIHELQKNLRVDGHLGSTAEFLNYLQTAAAAKGVVATVATPSGLPVYGLFRVGEGGVEPVRLTPSLVKFNSDVDPLKAQNEDYQRVLTDWQPGDDNPSYVGTGPRWAGRRVKDAQKNLPLALRLDAARPSDYGHEEVVQYGGLAGEQPDVFIASYVVATGNEHLSLGLRLSWAEGDTLDSATLKAEREYNGLKEELQLNLPASENGFSVPVTVSYTMQNGFTLEGQPLRVGYELVDEGGLRVAEITGDGRERQESPAGNYFGLDWRGPGDQRVDNARVSAARLLGDLASLRNGLPIRLAPDADEGPVATPALYRMLK